jgi:hypothetical protein
MEIAALGTDCPSGVLTVPWIAPPPDSDWASATMLKAHTMNTIETNRMTR